MNDIFKIIKSLGDPSVLINGATETVKDEITKQGRFLGALLAPSFSHFNNATSSFFSS